MNKIPIEVLLKFSRKECEELKIRVKELENDNRDLRRKVIIENNYKKKAKVEVRKEELYNELKRQLKERKDSLNKLKKDYNVIFCELAKYKQRYGNTL